jgi:hypothetical protein
MIMEEKVLRGRKHRVLLALMAQEVVTTREALEIGAPWMPTEVAHLRVLLDVFVLMAVEVFRVQEALATNATLMRSLRAVEVSLPMATKNSQKVGLHESRAEAYLSSQARSKVFPQPLCLQG